MAGHGDKLSRKQEQAVAALLTARTVAVAASTAGVSHRTLKTWLTLPAFKAAYQVARDEVLERAVALLLDSCGAAVDALKANLKGGKPADRTRAALGILDSVLRMRESVELRAEMAALRERLAALEPKGAKG